MTPRRARPAVPTTGSGRDVVRTLELLADRARDELGRAQATAATVAAVDKDDASPVTAVDLALQAAVLDTLADRHPDDGVLGEEGSRHPDRPRRWVCDPVDGTLGLVLGAGTSVFSLALVDHGVLVGAVVEVPARAERFLVRPDGTLAHTVAGATAPVAGPSPRAGLHGARVAVEVWPPSPGLVTVDAHRRLRAAGSWPVSLCAGTFAATCVARGVLDAVVLDVWAWWDLVAAAAVVEAAGGVATDLAGAPLDLAGPCRGGVLAASGVHAELVALLDRTGG